MAPDRLLPRDAQPPHQAKLTRLVGSNPARVGDTRVPQRRHQDRAQTRTIDRYEQYTAGTIKRCAYAYREFVGRGGQMFLSMAGALSTAGIGIWLNPLIRGGFVRGLSVTGANLEEDFFRLLGYTHYKQLPEYQSLSVTDDVALLRQHLPRVTSVAIPEIQAMRPLEDAVLPRWKAAQATGRPVFTHRVLYDVLRSGQLNAHYEADPETSWLMAAAELDLPVMVPGAEDSTLGQVFTAQCELGELTTTTLKNGYDYGREMIRWIRQSSVGHDIGFFQLGGGIAGDFSICGVPMIRQDMHDTSVPLWRFYAHIGDGQESWGGYSAALASEKASWGKLDDQTETFVMQSDATVVFPQIAEFLLEW